MSRNPADTPDGHVHGVFYPVIEYRNRVHLLLGGLYGLGWLRSIEREDAAKQTPVRTIDVPRELGYPPLPYDQYVANGVLEALNALAHRAPTHPLLGESPCETIQELSANPHRLIPDYVDFYTHTGARARPMDRAVRLSRTNPRTREEAVTLIHLNEISAPVPYDYRSATNAHA